MYSKTADLHKTETFYCVDLDRYDSDRNDSNFLKEIELYCREKGYHLIWFCRDIESVYIGKKVEDKKKEDTALRFARKNLISEVDVEKLISSSYRKGASNILKELDFFYQERNKC